MTVNIQPLPDTEHRQLIVARDKPLVGPRAINVSPVTEPAPTCTVVMVSFRTGPILVDSLRAALASAAVSKVVLVDNGNNADTRRAIAHIDSEEPRLDVLQGHGNIGFARACNLGVTRSDSDVVLLLNPDCILRPGVVERGLEVLAAHPEASALTVRIENTDGSEQRGARRNLMTPWTCLVEQFRLDRIMPNHPHFQRLNLNETEPLHDVSPVECISGAFMLLPRRVYEAAGGMDEDYFLHVEDVDFCMRLSKAGHTILYVPDVAVTHVKSTSRVSPLRIEWHKSVSVSTYFRKHFRPQYPDFILRLIGMAIFLRLVVRAVPITLTWVAERLRGANPEARRN
ncbi:MAG: glycosyltransferase family 2 protein [Alphaproteobacteria bacterium]|nr:glycosyltransferase family 2 protein [Alphaproteobacteria bacterium]